MIPIIGRPSALRRPAPFSPRKPSGSAKPELFSVLARSLRGIIAIAIALPTLRQIAAWAAMPAPPPVQRETVALSLEAILTITLVRRL